MSLWGQFLIQKRNADNCSIFFVSEVNKNQLVKGLEDVTLCEKEACTFEVVLSHAYVQGQWSRDGVPLKSRPVCRIATQGKKHTLKLTRVTVADMGVISFKAEGIESSAMLTVTGTIPSICNLYLMRYIKSFLCGIMGGCLRTQKFWIICSLCQFKSY